jgi:hypothetical protein
VFARCLCCKRHLLMVQVADSRHALDGTLLFRLKHGMKHVVVTAVLANTAPSLYLQVVQTTCCGSTFSSSCMLRKPPTVNITPSWPPPWRLPLVTPVTSGTRLSH